MQNCTPKNNCEFIKNLTFFVGKNWQQKVTEDVYKAMLDLKADVLIITQLDEIACRFS